MTLAQIYNETLSPSTANMGLEFEGFTKFVPEKDWQQYADILEKRANGAEFSESDAQFLYKFEPKESPIHEMVEKFVKNGATSSEANTNNREKVEGGIDTFCRLTAFNPISFGAGLLAGGGVGYAIYSSRAKSGNTNLTAPIFLGFVAASAVQTLGNYILNADKCKGAGKSIVGGMEQIGKDMKEGMTTAAKEAATGK